MAGNQSDIAIVGAGVLGRTLAITFLQRGFSVKLFERQLPPGDGACSSCAGGLLSPISELDRSDEIICLWGRKSIELWKELQETFADYAFMERRGSVILTQASDNYELRRLLRNLSLFGLADQMQAISSEALGELEPHLGKSVLQGYYIPGEGLVDVPNFMESSSRIIESLGGKLQFCSEVVKISQGLVETNQEQHGCSWVFDCRGLAGRDIFPRLRGVLGEGILIHAPEVSLSRPIRLMDARHPVYVVPRSRSNFFIGATQLESEMTDPVSVRSYLELLSAAYSLSSSFGEARVLQTFVNLRPAFQDNLPRVVIDPGIIRINGLFRHGYLLAPYFARAMSDYVQSGCIVNDMVNIVNFGKREEYEPDKNIGERNRAIGGDGHESYGNSEFSSG